MECEVDQVRGNEALWLSHDVNQASRDRFAGEELHVARCEDGLASYRNLWDDHFFPVLMPATCLQTIKYDEILKYDLTIRYHLTIKYMTSKYYITASTTRHASIMC